MMCEAERLRRVSALGAVLLAAGCAREGHETLPAIVVTAEVRVRCEADAGAPDPGTADAGTDDGGRDAGGLAGDCAPERPAISTPLCGYDVGPLAPDAGAVVNASQRASALTGLVEVRTVLFDLDGGGGALPVRRAMTTAGAVASARVFPAFNQLGALYEVDPAAGTIRVLFDAGVTDSLTVSAITEHGATFEYRSASGSSTRVVTESHTVAAAFPVDARVVDHSDQPFYGCCSHFGAGTPSLLLATLALVRPRRRPRSLAGPRPS